MYLVSIYFDEKSEDWIRKYIVNVAEKTGNSFMIDNKVPPHITIASFDTDNEEKVIENLSVMRKKLAGGRIQWASVGCFFPSVIYFAPVLNEYLHNLSVEVQKAINDIEGISISKYYNPFGWIPHATIGKKLSAEEMRTAFSVIGKSFGMFESQVVKIGLAKTNPYEEIVLFDL